MGLGNVRLDLDAAPVGLDRARRVAQVFADQPKREPDAAIVRPKGQGSFELGPGRLPFARLSQARSKRGSRFGKVRRRFKRPSEGDDRLPRAVDRLQRRAQSGVVHRIGRRFGRARKGRQGRLRLACLAQRLPDLAPAVDKAREAAQQVFKHGPRFPFPRLDEHHDTSGRRPPADRGRGCRRAPAILAPGRGRPPRAPRAPRR